jgi:hypothetical protein
MDVARYRTAKVSDFQLLSRLKDLSWLSMRQLKKIADAMSTRDVKRNSLISEERNVLNPDTHILLSGTVALSKRPPSPGCGNSMICATTLLSRIHHSCTWAHMATPYG